MKIEHLIRRDFLAVDPYSGVNAIKKELLERTAIVVRENDHFLGILTANDLVQNPKTLIIDCLSIKTSIDCEDTIEQVVSLMEKNKTDVLPVEKSSKFIGLIYKNDLYNYIADYNSELEQIVKERTQELEKTIAFKDMMFSIIAHDLRNPFNIILGFSELLSDNIDNYSIEETIDISKTINSQALKAFSLLDDLLIWAKTQINQVGFNPAICDISQICEEVIGHLTGMAQSKSISLKYLHNSQIYVYADKNMVETILRNLLSNAIKFTEINGKIEIHSNLKDSFVELIVSDNGIGLNAKDMENLFKLDFNKSKDGTAMEKGTGLGLIICKEFVAKNGGKIWVESKTEKGTDFKFTLPSYQNHLIKKINKNALQSNF